MNEKIKLLAEQATNIVEGWSDEHGTTRYYEFNKQKFAELIVKECADVAYKYNRCDWADVSKSIKEHFGVEE